MGGAYFGKFNAGLLRGVWFRKGAVAALKAYDRGSSNFQGLGSSACMARRGDPFRLVDGSWIAYCTSNRIPLAGIDYEINLACVALGTRDVMTIDMCKGC